MVANPGLRLKENPQNPESCRNLGIFFRVRNFWFLSCILLSLYILYACATFKKYTPDTF